MSDEEHIRIVTAVNGYVVTRRYWDTDNSVTGEKMYAEKISVLEAEDTESGQADCLIYLLYYLASELEPNIRIDIRKGERDE
jgi:hypothetical protein